MVCQSKSKIVKRGLKFSLNVEQIWRKQAPLHKNQEIIILPSLKESIEIMARLSLVI